MKDCQSSKESTRPNNPNTKRIMTGIIMAMIISSHISPVLRALTIPMACRPPMWPNMPPLSWLPPSSMMVLVVGVRFVVRLASIFCESKRARKDRQTRRCYPNTQAKESVVHVWHEKARLVDRNWDLDAANSRQAFSSSHVCFREGTSQYSVPSFSKK
jgi:hypothetical protein